MEFEQWWHQQMPNLVSGDEADDRKIALAAWNAASRIEREACAKVCDTQAGNTKDFRQEFRRGAGHCAAAIRAR